MSLVVCQGGLVSLLDTLRTSWGTLAMGLYASPHTPAPADDVSTYQAIESTFPGYLRQPLANWLPSVLGVDLLAVTLADIVLFTRTAGSGTDQVYGYFVVTPGGVLLWAEADPNAPVAMGSAGIQYAVTPQFKQGRLP